MLFIYLLFGLLILKISLEILFKVKPKVAIALLKIIKIYTFRIITLYAIITILLYKEINDIHFAYVFFILLTIGCVPMMVTFDKSKLN